MEEKINLDQEVLEYMPKIGKELLRQWNRFIGVMERGVDATEGLYKLAEMATKKDAERGEPWHEASDSLMECMVRGEVFIHTRRKDPIVTFQFTDPKGNFVTVDYRILNETDSQEIVEMESETGIKDCGELDKQKVLEIIGKLR